MEVNNIEKWEPVENIPREMFLEGLYDDYEGFRLLLKGADSKDKILKISFRTYLGYRTTEETSRLKTLHEAIIRGALNRARDSEYLNWLKEESGGIFNDIVLYHYIICCSDNIIDVISTEEPVVEWL